VLTGFAVGSFSARYRAALHHPATVEIGTVVMRIGNASFMLGQGVFDGDRCIATAEVVSVFFDPDSGRSRPLTDEVRRALESALRR
jgi:acyl-CoA thioester hydrolase